MWVYRQDSKTRYEQKEFPAPSVDSGITGSMGCTDTKFILFDTTPRKKNYAPVADTISQAVHPHHSITKTEFDIKPCSKRSGEYKMHNFFTIDNKPDIDILTMRSSVENIYTALPGSPVSSWSDPDSQSFLLGLYIFGKDLVQVRKFIECRKMGDILAYYYGKFYRSEAYRKWLECRKIRSRKSILGNRIFTGWRQQELLSRILPTVSKDVQDNLMEVTKSFNEGRASLENLVSNLKAKVGIHVLVEAIGIGKEKHDLTRIALDPSRSNQGPPICPEIPTGKACSSLSAGDIVKFLTGDFRLSKARSNDLFWEAVWPRLLARGWHSEQPKDFSSTGSKNTLVFIIPGVKKFSKRKLVKGNHYFDSISDVLSKVVSDPNLLELEVEGTESKDENGWGVDNRMHQTDLSTQQRQHYLRPKVPDGNSEYMKFTVVDTSLFQEEGPHKLRELRTLPVGAINFPIYDAGETDSESSSSDDDSDDSSSGDQGVLAPMSGDDKKVEESIPCLTDKAQFSGQYDDLNPSAKMLTVNGHLENEKCSIGSGGRPPAKLIKCQFSRNKNSPEQAYLAPVAKKRLVTSSYEPNSHCSYSSKRVQCSREELHQQLGAVRNSKNIGSISHPSENALFSKLVSSYNTNEDKNVSGKRQQKSAPVESTFVVETPQSRPLIDLNILPHISHEHAPVESFKSDASLDDLEMHEASASKDQEDAKASHDFGAIDTSISMAGDQDGSGNLRRQSSRNRPPTARALEALACGFIGTKRKGRDSGDVLSGITSSRTSRRARKTIEAQALVLSDNVASNGSNFEVPSTATVNDCYGLSTVQSNLSGNSYGESDNKGLDGMSGVS